MYMDLRSNQWFDMQAWSIECIAELYYYTIVNKKPVTVLP
ncbi:glycoside hydrolase family 48 protein [Paenibacillus sp. NRS-1782]